MPGFSGIDAMTEIRKTNSNIIFIVLTAYDKFKYAQDSIKLGVFDYINKPINQPVIVACLQQAMQQIRKEREKRSHELMIREKMEIVMPIVESVMIYSIIFQENYENQINNFKHLLGIRQEYGFMMVIECGDTIEGSHVTNALGASVKIQSYYQNLREIIKEYFYCIIGSMMANMMIVFVPCDALVEETEYEERIQLINKTREMIRRLRKQTDVQFRVSIGSIKMFEEANKSYYEAMNGFHYATGSVVHIKDLSLECQYEDNYPIALENQIFECTQKGDIQGTMLATNQFYDWLMKQEQGQSEDIRLKVLEFVLKVENIAYLSGGKTYYFNSRSNYLEFINNCNYDELKNWFQHKVQEAVTHIASKREKTTETVIDKAITYIQDHYQKDLSLDEVSKIVNISPYYFSKLFKEATGINFIDYLTNIRMTKAKELLQLPDKSMKEIGIEIGYSDPNYFSRTFKKNVGITPTQYKEEVCGIANFS